MEERQRWMRKEVVCFESQRQKLKSFVGRVCCQGGRPSVLACLPYEEGTGEEGTTRRLSLK